MWSDKKLFTIEQILNQKNNCIIRKNAQLLNIDVKTIYQSQKRSSVMVWGAVLKTWKSPLIFVESNTKDLIEAWDKILQLLLCDICNDIPRRFRAFIDNSGGHIE